MSDATPSNPQNRLHQTENNGLDSSIDRRLKALLFGAILLLIGWLYHPIIISLVQDWLRNEDDSQGLILFILAGYFLFRRRHEVKAMRPVVWPAWLLLVAGAALLYLAGHAAVEYYSQRISFVLLTMGLVAFLRGEKTLKALILPLLLLFLAVPLPATIVNFITLPLKSLVSSLAADSLRFFGVVVFQEGNILHLPGLTLEVVNACSGIRSIFTLMVLAIILAAGLDTILQRALLLCCTVPVALFTNAARITLTGLISRNGDNLTATDFYHGFSGWLLFVVSFILLLTVHRSIIAATTFLTRHPLKRKAG